VSHLEEAFTPVVEVEKPARPQKLKGRLPTVKLDAERAESSSPCAICLEDLPSNKKVAELNCRRHHFHTKCITQWLRVRRECPTCRRAVSFQRYYQDNRNKAAAAKKETRRAKK